MQPTVAQWAVLYNLASGNRVRPYGRGWVLMGWPFSIIPRRTWEPLLADGLVDEHGMITKAGREALKPAQRESLRGI